MDINTKIRLLEKLLDKSSKIQVESSNDSDFKSWKNLVERTLIKVFGHDSTEYRQYSNLKFYYQAMIFTATSDYSADHLKCYRRDMKILRDSITEYIEELKEEFDLMPTYEENNEFSNDELSISKIFISHASKDAELVEEVIEILETIGIDSNQIFCTSFEGYGIGLGENFLDAIKDELSSDSLILFILSKNFYESPACMCEMGATWVLSKEHIPIIVPPLSFDDVKGVIPLTQGLRIDDALKLNSLKEKVEKDFGIDVKLNFSTWERKRDRICIRIGKLLSNAEVI